MHRVYRWDGRPVSASTALVFDGNCGFCTLCIRVLQRLDRHGRVHLIPFQNATQREALGITEDQAQRSVWAVDVDQTGAPEPGRAASGAQAIAHVLDVAVGVHVAGWVYRLPGAGSVLERVYAWVARNRSRFPGVTPWCERPSQH